MLAGKNLRMTQKKASSADLIKKGLARCVKTRCVRVKTKHKINLSWPYGLLEHVLCLKKLNKNVSNFAEYSIKYNKINLTVY